MVLFFILYTEAKAYIFFADAIVFLKLLCYNDSCGGITMKLIAPEYYTKFHCIADKCRHSCCVGWEIAIDPDKLVYYRSIEGEFGARLQKGIAEADLSLIHI